MKEMRKRVPLEERTCSSKKFALKNQKKFYKLVREKRIKRTLRKMDIKVKDITWTPKSKKSARTISIIEPVAFQVLVDFFVDENTRLNINRIEAWTRIANAGERILNKTGRKRLYPHALRATYITMLLRRRMPMIDVKTAAGHESIEHTAKYGQEEAVHMFQEMTKIRVKLQSEKP